MKESVVVCLDIGGSHIAAATLRAEGGQYYALRDARGDVDSGESRDHILTQWDVVIRQVWDEQHQHIAALLIAMPGPFDYVHGICLMDGMHKYQALLHMDVRSYLSDCYKIPGDAVQFVNDAEAFLWGELYHYKLQKKRMVGLTLGTGLGSALYAEGEVKDLNYGSAIFREGIAEDYISTRGMLAFLQHQGVRHLPHVKALLDAEDLESERVAAFGYLSDALLDFLRQYILPLQTDGIVFGGNIAKAHRLFLPTIEKELQLPCYVASFQEWNLFLGLASSYKQ
ncbi:ROK family protein [Sphingobacterium deserti]|uniref:ROK family protein n=1 Tax=Sphingobacterium deserti TaxID=1229276 RepID=A0A0B8SZ49_9SPHI|nr:ROK family protein [Sphingobacterium deserti]KGE12616.1 ROK family protein [Sphingobacterium deserti]